MSESAHKSDHLTQVLNGRVVPLGRSGIELVLNASDALLATNIASSENIAVLGVEQFTSGMEAVDYSGYEFQFSGSWTEFVVLNNDAARQWLEQRAAQSRGFILTSVSKAEFDELAALRIGMGSSGIFSALRYALTRLKRS